MPLPQGYIHVLNHEKNCIKSDLKGFFLKLVTNERCQDVSVDIKTLSSGGCLPLPWGYIHVIKLEKCVKSDFEEIFFKLATNE